MTGPLRVIESAVAYSLHPRRQRRIPSSRDGLLATYGDFEKAFTGLVGVSAAKDMVTALGDYGFVCQSHFELLRKFDLQSSSQ